MKLIRIASVALFAGFAMSWNNGVGQKPPIGWNTEKVYGCSITEDIVKDSAQYMLQTGMKN